MNTLVVSFAGTSLEIRYGDGDPAKLVSFLFAKIPSTAGKNIQHTLTLDKDHDSNMLCLHQGATLIHQNQSIAVMAEFLMNQVCVYLATYCKKGLLLHSAAVRYGRRGLVMPGNSGAGKSTLTTWLLTLGADYQTDELVYIADRAGSNIGFPRPISIKSPARELIMAQIEERKTEDSIFSGSSVDLIAPDLLGSRIITKQTPIDFIFFPNYKTGGKLMLQRLSVAETVFELLKTTANRSNLSNQGLAEAENLARVAPAYYLSYGNMEQACQAIIDVVK